MHNQQISEEKPVVQCLQAFLVKELCSPVAPTSKMLEARRRHQEPLCKSFCQSMSPPQSEQKASGILRKVMICQDLNFL